MSSFDCHAGFSSVASSLCLSRRYWHQVKVCCLFQLAVSFFTISLPFWFLGLHFRQLPATLCRTKCGWQQQRFAPASWDNHTLYQPTYQNKLFYCHCSQIQKYWLFFFLFQYQSVRLPSKSHFSPMNICCFKRNRSFDSLSLTGLIAQVLSRCFHRRLNCIL